MTPKELFNNNLLIFNPPLEGDELDNFVNNLESYFKTNNIWSDRLAFSFRSIRETIIDGEDILCYLRFVDLGHGLSIKNFLIDSHDEENYEKLHSAIDEHTHRGCKRINMSDIFNTNNLFDQLNESRKKGINIIKPSPIELFDDKFLHGKAWHMDLKDIKNGPRAQEWLFKNGFRWPDHSGVLKRRVNFQSIWYNNIREKSFTGSESLGWDINASISVVEGERIKDIYYFHFEDIMDFTPPDSEDMFNKLYEGVDNTSDYTGLKFTHHMKHGGNSFSNGITYTFERKGVTPNGEDGWVVSWSVPQYHWGDNGTKYKHMKAVIPNSDVERNISDGTWVFEDLPSDDDVSDLFTKLMS